MNPARALTSWELLGAPAGRFADPEALAEATGWASAVVPGTVAQALGAAAETADLDGQDWWYRTRFDAKPGPARLRFEGLATIAQVWLNGRLALEARNMFRPHALEAELRADNELVICFRALSAELALKRPRPRWKTALVASQNLRFVRTTLVGRIPAWCPPVPPIGPWREVRVEPAAGAERLHVVPRVVDHQARLRIDASFRLPPQQTVRAAWLEIGGARHALEFAAPPAGGAHVLAHVLADVALGGLELWWPHTHGRPTLHAARLGLETSAGEVTAELGALGFRAVELDESGGGVRFVVNGVATFMRGACWTVSDLASFGGDRARLRAVLEEARRANLNLIRLGGTMAYGSDELLRLCDELGVMVWQDFAFANLDYPVADPAFAAEIQAEASHQIARLARHACVVAYCGGSEVQQQAAMMGLPREAWSNVFFDRLLPARRDELHPGTPYFPSSPCASPAGRGLPFHAGDGIAHYYGVGAYRRPLADARAAGVKFASECLGLSNVPDADEILAMADGGALPPPHSPRWKAGVPRDRGAGYDFEDVRDHYLRELFGLDPVALRAQDVARYYDVSRAVSGEVMKRVFAEWRRPGGGCGGGLVWFLQDLAPGAGWGLLDHRGRPKAALRSLARAWAPRAVLLTDEGVDGLAVHVLNDTAAPLRARVELTAYQHGRIRGAQAAQEIEVGPRGALSLNSDAMLGYFADLTNAYRFGPAKQDVVHVAVREAASGALVSEDFHFPVGMNLPPQFGAQVEAAARRLPSGEAEITISSDVFLQNVQVQAAGFVAADDSFHLAPGGTRTIRLRRLGAEPALGFKAELSALNWPESRTVRAEKCAEEARP